MNNYSSNTIFDKTTPVVTNIIIINVLMLLADHLFNLNFYLALYYPASSLFQPYQFVTYMFTHGGIWHLVFNMYALWMFGKVLERVWGSRRFFIFYFVCGIGAAAFYMLVNYFQYRGVDISAVEASIGYDTLEHMKEALRESMVFKHQTSEMMTWYNVAGVGCVGASGAVFGVLLGFGMLFPNTVLQLLFPPIALKAKWFVIIYGALELVLAIRQPGSGIAHTAHLGGILFGFILIKIWGKQRNTFY